MAVLDNDFSFPFIHPMDLLTSLGQAGFVEYILGVPVADAESHLSSFWAKFRKIYPNHDLCHSETNWSNLIPYYLHGDGGRTFKKDPILILSMYSCLGRGTASKPVSLKRSHEDAFAEEGYDPGVNLRGHSFTHRFLFTAMRAEFYKKKTWRFERLVDEWGKALAFLYTDGIALNGRTWRIAVVGLTGDAPFLREAGFHQRSFSNVKKSHESKTAAKGVCWLCTAGMEGGPRFEDLRIHGADWIATCGANNIIPWETPGPLLAHLCIDQESPAEFYRPDLFHVFHAGVGKDWCASAIIYLCKKPLKQRSIAKSLALVNEEFQKYLRRSGKRVAFSHFTLDLLSYGTSGSYPAGKRSKNMDTAVICQFVEDLSLQHVDLRDVDSILELIVDGSNAASQFMHVLFHGSFWLSEGDAWQAISSGHSFLQCYSKLAAASHTASLCLFKLKPKIHTLCHIVRTMYQQFLTGTDCVINPVAESTFMSEDFVGHVSRLSRRVNPRRQGERVYNRYLVALREKLDASRAR